MNIIYYIGSIYLILSSSAPFLANGAPLPTETTTTQVQTPTNGSIVTNLAPLLPSGFRDIVNSLAADPGAFLAKTNKALESVKVQEVPGDYIGTLIKAAPQLMGSFNNEFGIKSDPNQVLFGDLSKNNTNAEAASVPPEDPKLTKMKSAFFGKIQGVITDSAAKVLGIPEGTLAHKIMTRMIANSLTRAPAPPSNSNSPASSPVSSSTPPK